MTKNIKNQNVWMYLSKALILLFLWPTVSFSQKVVEYSNIKVGDTAPDILFKNLTKYKRSEQKLSEFSEKLLILDFWATWCDPCVGMLPRMDSLRKMFKDDLIFISITDQPKSYAEPFLGKVEKNSNLSFDIPVIYGDTYISKLFSHRLLPHYVWLDVKTRKVLAISGLQNITKENVSHYLKTGELNNIPIKNDQRLDYDKSKPLLGYLFGTSDQGNKYLPVQYSSFWSYIPELKSGITSNIYDSADYYRITVRNDTKQQLIQYAFGEGRRFFQSKSVLVESKDKDILHTNLANEPYFKWREQNAITYEISVTPDNRGNIFEMMRKDLINYFREYDIRIEKRKTNCLVLISTGSNEPARSKGGKPKVTKDQFSYDATNISLDAFFQDLSFKYLSDSPVLVNETAIKYNIDLHLDILNFRDLNQVNKELGKYNLKFVEKEALGEFLVIGDKIEKSSSN